jgi:hypothetical protein
MEEKREVKTYMIDYTCDKCDSGKMRPIRMLMCNPPKWVHKCESCGLEKTFDVKYPYTTYEYYG